MAEDQNDIWVAERAAYFWSSRDGLHMWAVGLSFLHFSFFAHTHSQSEGAVGGGSLRRVLAQHTSSCAHTEYIFQNCSDGEARRDREMRCYFGLYLV
jgi:hypothetical protein